MQGHQRSSEVIKGHQRSSEVFRHLAVSQHASELERFLGVAETAAAQVVGVPARQSCIIMYPHMPSCVLGSQPRVYASNQRTGWESAAVSTCMQGGASSMAISVPVGKAWVTQLAVEGVAHGRRWEDEDFGASVQKVIIRNLDHGRGLPGAGSVDNEHPGIRQAAGMAQEGDSLLVALEPRFDRLPYPLDRA